MISKKASSNAGMPAPSQTINLFYSMSVGHVQIRCNKNLIYVLDIVPPETSKCSSKICGSSPVAGDAKTNHQKKVVAQQFSSSPHLAAHAGGRVGSQRFCQRIPLELGCGGFTINKPFSAWNSLAEQTKVLGCGFITNSCWIFRVQPMKFEWTVLSPVMDVVMRPGGCMRSMRGPTKALQGVKLPPPQSWCSFQVRKLNMAG